MRLGSLRASFLSPVIASALVCLLLSLTLPSSSQTVVFSWGAPSLIDPTLPYADTTIRTAALDENVTDLTYSILSSCLLATTSAGSVYSSIPCSYYFGLSEAASPYDIDVQTTERFSKLAGSFSLPGLPVRGSVIFSLLGGKPVCWMLNGDGNIRSCVAGPYSSWTRPNITMAEAAAIARAPLDVTAFSPPEAPGTTFTSLQGFESVAFATTSSGKVFVSASPNSGLLGYNYTGANPLYLNQPFFSPVEDFPTDWVSTPKLDYGLAGQGPAYFAVALVDGELFVWGQLAIFRASAPADSTPTQESPYAPPIVLGYINLNSSQSINPSLSALRVDFSEVFTTTPLWSHASGGRDHINLVAENGTVVRIGPQGAVYHIQSVETILAAYSPGSSSGLADLASSYSAVQYLFSDGTMYSIFDDISDKSRIQMLATVPDNWDPNVPVKADFGTAVPPNYKVSKIYIKDILGFSGGIGMAVPKTRADTTVAPLVITPRLTDRPLALWGFGSGYMRSSIPYSSAAFLDMRIHPDFNSFAKYAFTASHALFLTTNGSVLASGSVNFGSMEGTSPLETEVSWTSIHPLPQWLFGDLAILDIAVGTDDSLVIASNGSLFYWGHVTNMRAAKRDETRRASTSSSTIAEDLSMSKALRYDPPTPSRPFIKVWASGSQFAAVDSSGLLYTWGSNWTYSESEYFTPVSHPNLLSSYGAVANFTFAGPERFYVLTSDASHGSRLILATSMRTDPASGAVNDEHAWYTVVDPTGQSSLSPSDVAQIDATKDFCLILSRSGRLYGLGTHALWFNNGTVPGNYSYPQLVTIRGLSSVNARKIALNQQLYALDDQGRLFATGGDTLSDLDGKDAAKRILSGHKVLDIFSWSDDTVGSGALLRGVDPFFDQGGMYLAIAEPSPTFVPQPDWSYEPHYMTATIGTNLLHSAIDASDMASMGGYARLLPVGHPLERSTTRFTNDTGSAWIYSDGLYPDGTPRKIFSESSFASLFPHTTKPSYFPRAADKQASKLVHTHVAYTAFHLFYDNCTILQIKPTNMGVWVSVDVSQFSSFESGFDTDYAAALSASGTPSYQQMYGLEFDLLTKYEHPQCALEGGTIVNVVCHSLADSYPSVSSSAYDASHWCVQLSGDGSIFTYGLYHSPTVMACQTGTLGEPADCTASSVLDELYTLQRVSGRLNTTGTIFDDALQGTNKPGGVQFSLGPQHALLVSSDGQVFGWGTNTLGQLSLAPTLGTIFPRLTELTPNLAASPGAIPSAQNATALVRHANGSSNIRSVLVSYRTSFAVLAGNTDIYAWGDNRYGLLGRGPESTTSFDLFSPNAARVNLPVNRPFLDFQCASTTCYVLYDDGTLYSWGSNAQNALARPISASTRLSNFGSPSSDADPTPLPVSMLTFPGRQRKIVEMKSSPSAARLVLRATLVDPSPQPSSTSPTPTTLRCRGNPPTPSATCVDGTWISNGDVTIGGASPASPHAPSSPSTPYSRPTLVIPSTTVIIGNLTVGSDALIIAELPLDFSTNKPLLNVTGCVFIEGELQITIDPTTWEQVKKKLDGKSALLIESSCGITVANLTTTLKAPKDCRVVKAKTSTSKLASGSFALSSVFIVDSKKCTRWAIILGSVLGAVIVISAVIAVACSIRRGNQSSTAAHRLKHSVTG